MVEVALHSMEQGSRPSILANLLASLSQEFHEAAQLPTNAAADAAAGRDGAAVVLKRLLAVQREASDLSATSGSDAAGGCASCVGVADALC